MNDPPAEMNARTFKTAIIACAVIEAEVRALAPPGMPMHVLPQGLHNTPNELRARLQELVGTVDQDPAIEFIALAYGLCSRGTEGVSASRCTLILPRAHDCITLL